MIINVPNWNNNPDIKVAEIIITTMFNMGLDDIGSVKVSEVGFQKVKEKVKLYTFKAIESGIIWFKTIEEKDSFFELIDDVIDKHYKHEIQRVKYDEEQQD